MQRPKSITALWRVIGVFGFYRQFVKGAAQYLAPLNELLKGRTRKNDQTPINWTPELTDAFDKAKIVFSKYTSLHFYKNNSKLILTSDASGIAVGAVIEQITAKGEREPLGFFSKKLTDSQLDWPVYDKELYAIYSSLEHYEYLLQGREVTIYTDHKPLTFMFTVKKLDKIERRNRQIQYISQFTTDIRHISGSANIIADMLSRPEIPQVASINVTITHQDIARAQKDDPEIQNILKNGLNDHTIEAIQLEENLNLICGKFNR